MSSPAQALGLTLAFALGAPMTANAAGPVVQTKEGAVKGFHKNNVAEFLGIPYAVPPVGNLRWRPPKPHAPWTTELQATKFGATCAQIATLGVFAGPANNNEDCLFLNVFTPNPAASAHLPVIFWIHGGGNVDGESNDYDGSKLAFDGKTVVVTLNYRLNLMGFLAHPALDKEGHLFANYGLLDQQLAMKWVKKNIEAFGGDPNNITVGGQSAGAGDTAAQLISPLTKGLFQRAILQSGLAYFSGNTPLDKAESNAIGFAVAAGCGSGTDAATATCLRNLPASTVESLAGTTSGSSPYITYYVEDGQIIPGSFTSAFETGNFNRVPIMNGTVQDEGNFGLAGTEYFKSPRVPFTADDFTNYVTRTYSGNAGPGGSPPAYPPGTVDKVLAQYRLKNYPTPQLALDAAQTDTSACRSLHGGRLLSKWVPVYNYEFRDRTAPSYFPPLPGFVPLAYHTADIQYIFPLYHGGPVPPSVSHQLNTRQEKLSDEMVSAWANFAATGNPNGAGNQPWPLYKGQGGYYLSQDLPALSTFPDSVYVTEHKCKFWDQILVNN